VRRVLFLALVIASLYAKAKGLQPFGFSTGS
jgi:hypothetical protein